MKNKWIALFLILMLCVGLTACGSKQAADRDSASSAASASNSAEASDSGQSSDSEPISDEELNARVNEILSGMTTEQKLAQMMIVALRSDPENTYTTTEITPEYVELLEKYNFGGIILFEGNIEDAEQAVTLIHDSQMAAIKSSPGIPMLIGVDQEGGMVNRVSFGTVSSGNMALAASGETSLTEESADMIGKELKVLGFNLDFAPDADVNSNPNNPIIGVRSFSDDPSIAAEHTGAFVKGLHASGVCAALKHFPGHGNVSEDSHTHLPASDYSLEDLRNCDLIPFKAGIDAGADMIMTAHIQYPGIEKGTYQELYGDEITLPATLSHTIITGILREELGFDGVIVTDSMSMDAIADHFDETDAAVLAINAGVDMLLCPVDLYQGNYIDTFPEMDSYMEKLLERVEAGDIKTEELDDSVSRILKLKLRRGIVDEPFSDALDDQIDRADVTVGCSEHCEKEWRIAERGLTLLKNKGEMLPLDGTDGSHTLILVPDEDRIRTVEYAMDRLEYDILLEPNTVKVLSYRGMWSGDWELQEALSEAKNVLILSDDTEKNDIISSVIEQVHSEKSGKVAILSLGLPYDAACYPEADAIMCAYNSYGLTYDENGDGPFNLNVAVCLCAAFGESVPRGTLPVNIPKLETNDYGESVYTDEVLFERGFGLKNWEE